MITPDQSATRSLKALRAQHRRGTLSPLVAAVMAQVDPLWGLLAADRTWMVCLSALDAYIARERHTRIPERHSEGEVALGVWAVTCRRDFAAGRLSIDREQRLITRPEWVWSVHEDSFAKNLAALDRYIEAEGRTDVSADFVDVDGAPLGKWCGWQRTAYAAGTLPALREDALNARPEWSWGHDVT